MTIILFLVDTSASMCQKAYVNGVHKSYLDIAKGAVETFLKFRQRTQDCLGDRYMLLTFDDPPSHVKAGWKENIATLMNELKNLQSNGLTSMGEALRNAFDLLNLNRMQSGIDTYGQGRCPFYLEPSVIIVITDGGRHCCRNMVPLDFSLPASTQISSKYLAFTKEPFRWDQRLFSLVLRIPGTKVEERVETKLSYDDANLERMCEVTGGRSYRVRTHYQLNQCIESLVQKVQPGVVLQFEPCAPKDDSTHNHDIIFQPTKRMIYVQKHISQKTFPIGYWPLPEPYWPDPKATTLPPRDAHPRLKIVTPAVDEPQLVRNFPVDKYEVEPSPVTLQILNKREPNKCWQVIVSNGVHGLDLPFGYLKASSNFTQVHLYVLAYNYPALMPLLHDLVHKYNMNPHPHQELMYKFAAYVRSIPAYYYPFLRKALASINVPYPMMPLLLPEGDNYLPQAIASSLKVFKNTGKLDQENLCLKVHKQLKQPKLPYRPVETAKLCTAASTRREFIRHPFLRETFAKMHADIELNESHTMLVPQQVRQPSAKSYRNPFDITRRDLVTDIARMRESFLRTGPISLVAKDAGHCLPVAEMGNYQEYLKNKENPLREIEPTNVRQHMFGNPYKKDKHMVMVDEADLSDVAPVKVNGHGHGHMNMHGNIGGPGMGGTSSSKKSEFSRSRKRRPGPLPTSFSWRSKRIKRTAQSTASRSSNVADTDSDTDSDTSSVCSSSSGAGSEPDNDQLRRATNDDSRMPLESSDCESSMNGFEPSLSSEHARDDKCADNATTTATIAPPTSSTPSLMTTKPSALTAAPALRIISTLPPTVIALAPGTRLTVGLVTPKATAAAAVTSTPTSNSASHPEVVPEKKHYVTATPINGLSKAVYAGYAALSLTGGRQTEGSAMPLRIVKPTVNGHTSLHLPITANHNNSSSLPSGSLTGATSPATASIMGTGTATLTSLPTTTLTVTPTTPSTTTSVSTTTATTSYYSHSDINDASEISRILQTCHNLNGSGSTSSASTLSFSSVAASNNNNNNNSSSSSNSGNDTSTSSDTAVAIASTTANSTPTISSATLSFVPLTVASGNTNSFDTLKREYGKPNGLAALSASSQQLWPPMAPSTYSSSGSALIGSVDANSAHNLRSSFVRKPEQAATVAEPTMVAAAVSRENQDSQSTTLSVMQDEQADAHNYNRELRLRVWTEIRRPGRDYTRLLDELTQLQGDNATKSEFMAKVFDQIERFRRQQMLKAVKDWWSAEYRPPATIKAEFEAVEPALTQAQHEPWSVAAQLKSEELATTESS